MSEVKTLPPITDHHRAEYNISRIIEEMVLLEDHYKTDRCADCVIKHIYTIRALAIEGLGLTGADAYEDLLHKARKLAEDHLRTVLKSVHGGLEVDFNRLIQEVRALRKEMVWRLYGLYELDSLPAHAHPH